MDTWTYSPTLHNWTLRRDGLPIGWAIEDADGWEAVAMPGDKPIELGIHQTEDEAKAAVEAACKEDNMAKRNNAHATESDPEPTLNTDGAEPLDEPIDLVPVETAPQPPKRRGRKPGSKNKGKPNGKGTTNIDPRIAEALAYNAEYDALEARVADAQDSLDALEQATSDAVKQRGAALRELLAQ